MQNKNLKLGVEVDKTELKEALDLAKKLKFELREVEKQLKKISKLGVSKRQLKQIFKNWKKEI